MMQLVLQHIYRLEKLEIKLCSTSFLKKLGKNIARLRMEAGITQTDLALKCDKDQQSLNRLEKGRINPSAFYLSQIPTELELPLKELFDFK